MQLSDGKIQRIEFVGKVDRVLNQNKQQDQNQNQNKQQNQNQTNQEQQNQQDRTPRIQQDQNQVQIKGKLKFVFFTLFFLIVFL